MINYHFVANMNMNVDKGQLENLLCPPWLDWNLSMFGNNELWPNLLNICVDSSDNGSKGSEWNYWYTFGNREHPKCRYPSFVRSYPLTLKIFYITRIVPAEQVKRAFISPYDFVLTFSCFWFCNYSVIRCIIFVFKSTSYVCTANDAICQTSLSHPENRLFLYMMLILI